MKTLIFFSLFVALIQAKVFLQCDDACMCFEEIISGCFNHCMIVDQCPPICGVNKAYRCKCEESYCNKTEPYCYDCKFGCFCAEGYKKNELGNCVPASQCNHKSEPSVSQSASKYSSKSLEISSSKSSPSKSNSTIPSKSLSISSSSKSTSKSARSSIHSPSISSKSPSPSRISSSFKSSNSRSSSLKSSSRQSSSISSLSKSKYSSSSSILSSLSPSSSYISSSSQSSIHESSSSPSLSYSSSSDSLSISSESKSSSSPSTSPCSSSQSSTTESSSSPSLSHSSSSDSLSISSTTERSSSPSLSHSSSSDSISISSSIQSSSSPSTSSSSSIQPSIYERSSPSLSHSSSSDSLSISTTPESSSSQSLTISSSSPSSSSISSSSNSKSPSCGRHESFCCKCPDSFCNKKSPECKNCVSGCHCDEGYVREYEGGECILADSCSVKEPKCGANQTYSCKCVDPVCNQPDAFCEGCVLDCYCKEGYKREKEGGACILASDCVKSIPSCGSYEVYGCECPDQICNQDYVPCAKCTDRCHCIQGYKRTTATGICVKEEKCILFKNRVTKTV